MKNLKALFFCLVLCCFSCETEKTETQNIDSTQSLESINAKVEIENALSRADDALDNISFYSTIFDKVNKTKADSSTKNFTTERPNFFGNCVDIMTIRDDASLTITFTFTGECEDKDGNLITGVITKNIMFGQEDFQHTLSIENLTVNGYVINGTKTQSSVSSNENGNQEISGTVDLSIQTDSGTITRVGNRTIEIIEGGATETFEDDVRSITGSFTYTGLESSFSTEITSALIKPADCRYIVAGVKVYMTQEGETTLYYGDGTCDEFATVTFPDGTQEELSLKEFRRNGNNGNGNSEEDQVSTSRCVITTDCEEVVLEDISNLSITVNQVEGVFVIEAKNGEGEVVYEAECAEGPNVSVRCSSRTANDEDDSTDEEENNDEDDNTSDDSDDAAVRQCTITTACEVVVIENTSEVGAEVTQSGDIFLIVARNQEGEIVYQAECESAQVSVECTSQDSDTTNDEDDEMNNDEDDDNDQEDDSNSDEAGDNDEDDDSNSDGGDDSDEDNDTSSSCTITTLCEEVVIENTSAVSVDVTAVDGTFIIIGTNEEGTVVYEGKCDRGAGASVRCSS